MGLGGFLFLGTEDNERITAISKEKGIDRDLVEVEYNEMLKRLEVAKKEIEK